MAGLAAAVSGAAQARPVGLDDLLHRASFGTVAVAAGGRLLFEERRPFDEGARYDFGDFNVLFRNRLLVADANQRGPLRPLLVQAPRTGYALGPLSPDGRRVVVYRLTGRRFELGVVDLAAGKTRWLGVTPQTPQPTRTLAWASSTELLAIAVLDAAPGVPAQPYALRAARPQWAGPPRWTAMAHGGTAVGVLGSGRLATARRAAPAQAVLRISILTGRVTPLFRGEAVDLELSASGRRLAILEADGLIPLAPGAPVQGPNGIAVRRARLRILDLTDGRVAIPCPRCDVLTSLLAWRPDADELLAYVRDDGAPWAAGRLLRIDAASGLAHPLITDVAAAISNRPERVAAGWWAGEPLLFGRRAGAGRDDWFRLTPAGSIDLTGALAHPSRRDLVVAGAALVMAADDRGWRIDPTGRATPLADAPFRALADRSEGVPERTTYALGNAAGLAGVLGDGAGSRIGWLKPDGRFVAVASLPPGAAVAAASPRGAAVIEGAASGPQRLAWSDGGGGLRPLAIINRPLADLAWPRAVRVDQTDADGEVLHHWVLLPPGAAPGARLPLVVVPYPGRRYGTEPPRPWDDGLMWPATALVGAGYAVLTPSLPSRPDAGGPAAGLGDRVLSAAAAAAANSDLIGRIDPGRLGAWGHSFGGYGVAVLLSQTDRFAAGVAVEPPTDLVSFWGRSSPARRANPDDGPGTYYSAGWTEDLQGEMRAPPWAAPERYLANSPLFAADRIRTPLMLVAGDQDGDHLGQAEELFSALYRQSKDAVLVTYWGEPHVFGSPGDLRDLYRRGVAFLDARLRPERLRPSGPADGAGPLGRRPGSATASGGPSSPGRRPVTGPGRRRRG